mmetsp:Transcript_15699/g.52895  ORF Transcript_15699/g.52895 Transcript_15699/m.52895 type:complete len:266 (-) Transcript_15699:762-1559(-)
MGADWSKSRATWPLFVKAGGARAASVSIEGRPLVYCHIHLRSIQSLRSQSHFACKARSPREATAVSSPQPKRPKKSDCGMCVTESAPVSSATMFVYKSMPAMTAKTPAFGRGCPTTAQQSPAAKTFRWPKHRSSVSTRRKPSSSVRRPLLPSHAGAAADVHQTHSAKGTNSSPPCTLHRSTFWPSTTPTASQPKRTKMPRPASCSAMSLRTPGECPPMSCLPRVSSENRASDGSLPRFKSSARTRVAIANTSSTPPPPPPTTTMS